MFLVSTVQDTIRLAPALLGTSTTDAVVSELDQKYPNRVLMDVGLVVARTGKVQQLTHGMCVAGDGGCHVTCRFQLIVFRPFVEQVLVGKISRSSPEGVQVTLGFFHDIFVPAFWMLNPSQYEEATGLWVWTPQYDDEEGEEEDEDDKDKESGQPKGAVEDTTAAATIEKKQATPNRYEMEIGASIRFKVKSLHFTQITNTAKGRQATTTTTARNLQPSASSGGNNSANPHSDDPPAMPVRRRSSSVGLDETADLPASMQIVASICEDGLGLVSWWTQDDDDDEEEAEADDDDEVEVKMEQADV